MPLFCGLPHGLQGTMEREVGIQGGIVLELEALVRETMELSGALASEEEGLGVLPDTPGLFYSILVEDEGFRIEGLSSGSLQGNTRSGHSLFFQTSSLEEAQAVEDELFHRKFPLPYKEAPQWRMIRDELNFTLFFFSSDSNHLPLGPLGEAKVAIRSLGALPDILEGKLSMSHFHCDTHSMELSFLEPSPCFEEIKDIFLTGTFPDGGKPHWGKDRTLIYFLRELAIIRRFWLEVEGQL